MPHDDAAIRTGLATNLIPLGIRVSPYALNNPASAVPCAYVMAGPINYHQSMGGGMEDLEYRVVVALAYDTSAEVDVAAQETLADYRADDGASSVRALIESDRTLGGACDDLIVTEASEPTIYLAGTGAAILGCEFTVKIVT
jgi:hypothetical protein